MRKRSANLLSRQFSSDRRFTVGRDSFARAPRGNLGPVRLPFERLKQWEMNYTQLIDALFAEVPLRGSREEVVRDRIWRLGKARCWPGYWEADGPLPLLVQTLALIPRPTLMAIVPPGRGTPDMSILSSD